MNFLPTAFQLLQGTSTAAQHEEDVLKLARLWEQLVAQLDRVERSVSSLSINKPSILQAQSLLFATIKLVQILDDTATYAERVRKIEASQVEEYYPKLKALATPLTQLIKAFINRKPAIDKFQIFGALEIVSFNLRRLIKGYHRLVTDSIEYLPMRLQEEAVPIKQGVDESLTELLTVYNISGC